MSERPRRPAAFNLGDADVVVARPGVEPPASAGTRVVVEPDIEETAAVDPALPSRRSFGWGKLFWSALTGLVTLAIGLSVDRLIRDLFARQDWLGWLGLGLAALAAVAALAIAIREIVGIARIARIDSLREQASEAVAADDADKAGAVANALVSLYGERPETAKGRASIAGHLAEIIDGRDLMVLVESDLLVPLDALARRLVSEAARNVSVVTAVSPRAIVDLLFVLVTVMGLIRKLAALYGGRPGLIGSVTLLRHVVGHLAVTGGMAAGDSIVQQVLGHGIAARLSARLGEGVVNGLLTARIGLAAIDVCRPMPFVAASRPNIGDVMAGVLPEGREKA